MSRVHAITALVAVAVHVLLAAPWLRRARESLAASPKPAVEIPVEVAAAPEPPRRHAKRAKAATARAPVQKPVATAAPANPASPAAPARASEPASALKHAEKRPASASSPVGEPLALMALASQSLLGERSTGALLIHSRSLREHVVAAELAKPLSSHSTLAKLSEGGIHLLRDCDEVLLTGSAQDGGDLVLVQYNAVRYKVRVAAAQSGVAYALPVRELLALGEGAPHFATKVAKDFRLPAGAEDDALSAYAKPPHVLSVSVLPAKARWLTLSLSQDGSGELRARAVDGATLEPTPVAKSDVKAVILELLAVFR